MAWKCPACTAAIAHRVGDERKNTRYRCPVCRLGLLWDEDTQAFVVISDDGTSALSKRRINSAA